MEPDHASLEKEFFAALPPRPAPWHRRAVWWGLLSLLRFRVLRALLLRAG